MIKLALGLDISDFQSKLKKATADLKGLGAAGTMKAAATAVKAFGPEIAAVMAIVTAAAIGMYKAMGEGDELVDLQERTGIAIENLMALKLGFEQAGLGAEEVGPTINKLQKHIAEAAQGNAQAAETFSKLGIELGDLVKLSPDKQLEAVGEAIKKIANPAQKAQVAMEVFGKSGGKMLSLFAAGGLDQAAVFLGNQAKLMAENAGLFGTISDALGSAGKKIQGFFVGMASKVAPELLFALDAFQKLDLSQIGEAIGTIFAVLIRGVRLFGAILGDGVAAVVADLSIAFGTVQEAFISGFKTLTSMTFWSGLLDIFVGIAQKFGATMLESIPGMGKAAETLRAKSEANFDSAQTKMSAIAQQNETSFNENPLIAGGIEERKKAGESFQKTWDAVFNTSFEEAGKAAREKFKTPDVPSPTDGLSIVPQMKGAGEGILSSFAKIGGAVGGVSGGADPQLDQLRVQTTTLQSMLGRLDQLIAVTREDSGVAGGGMVLA